MPQVQIKNRYTNAVLFECEVPDGIESGLHMRHALEKACDSGAYLTGAYLSGANLTGANLTGANLTGELKLSGDRPFFSVGPIGSRSDMFQAFTTDHGLRLKAGCFFGTVDEFRSKLIDTHGINVHREEYEAALLLIEKHAALWPAVKTQE